VDFVKLPDQQVTLTDNQEAYSIELGSLRTSRQYEFNVLFLNSRSREFKPTKGKVSCNCLIGSFDDKSIEPGQTGRISVRIRTKAGGGEYAQVAIIESSAGDPLMLNIRGVALHGLEFANLGSKVTSLKQGEVLDAVLEPQFSDIDLNSVVLTPQTGVLDVTSSKIDGNKIRLKLLVLRAPSTNLLQESFKLKFNISNSTTSVEESLDFLVRSKAITIRPSIVKLTTPEDESSTDSNYVGTFWITNPPEPLGKVGDGKIEILLDTTEEVLASEVSSLAKEDTGLKCEFRVAIPKSIAGKQPRDNWMKLLVRIDGQEVGRLRCILVRGH
jgi:hypothetical protein